jgi:MFS family permease
MPALPEAVLGSRRAVSVLAVTQILAWGMIFYPPVLTLPLIAADRGWSLSFAMSGFSVGLLAAGCVAPCIGILIDRYGGHRVMSLGSILGALGLFGLVHANERISYFAVWIVLGAAMSASLYDSAFATLARIFGRQARRPITMLAIAGGFASTVSWPMTHLLTDAIGWRGTYLVFAGLLALLAAPLHLLGLPRSCAEPLAGSPAAEAPVGTLRRKRVSVVLIATVFAANAFIFSGLSAHLLAVFNRLGLEAGTVVAIGALAGPSQVIARVSEFLFARNVHPLWIARFAVVMLIAAFTVLALSVALFGFSASVAAVFTMMFAVTNGLMSVARGSVPLALFGPAGYGKLIGRMAVPQLVMQSAAPLVLTFVAEHGSDPAGLALLAAIAIAELACLGAIRRPTSRN